jgi:hypothetical protein
VDRVTWQSPSRAWTRASWVDGRKQCRQLCPFLTASCRHRVNEEYCGSRQLEDAVRWEKRAAREQLRGVRCSQRSQSEQGQLAEPTGEVIAVQMHFCGCVARAVCGQFTAVTVKLKWEGLTSPSEQLVSEPSWEQALME